MFRSFLKVFPDPDRAVYAAFRWARAALARPAWSV